MTTLTAKQKEILHDVLARCNQRRASRGRSRLTVKDIPSAPLDLDRLYLVDTYTVRRHWRRRPVLRH